MGEWEGGEMKTVSMLILDKSQHQTTHNRTYAVPEFAYSKHRSKRMCHGNMFELVEKAFILISKSFHLISPMDVCLAHCLSLHFYMCHGVLKHGIVD